MYKVEHLYSYGWDDADWWSDGKPWLFETAFAAWQEVIGWVDEARASGLDYTLNDYRVVEV